MVAHEAAHAVQDADGYVPLKQRTRWAGRIGKIQRIGSVLLFAAPFVGALNRDPDIFLITAGAGFAFISVSILVHALTLPVEPDASRPGSLARSGGAVS